MRPGNFRQFMMKQNSTHYYLFTQYSTMDISRNRQFVSCQFSGESRASGKHFRDYNREQQAQIAQDYYVLLSNGGVTTDYDPFIAELRAGDL